MPDPTPAVSVIVACYNHERFVTEALDSVAAQTFSDFELIITDDCSSDRSVERIRDWLDSWRGNGRLMINTENVGVCATLNRALTACSGSFVTVFSADDISEPRRLELQLQTFISSPPTVGVVYSDFSKIDATGEIRQRGVLGEPKREGYFPDEFARGCAVWGPAVMIRRSALDEIGGYDEALTFEDWDVLWRLAEHYEFKHCEGQLARWRELPTSLSNDPANCPGILGSVSRLLAKHEGRDAALDARIDTTRNWWFRRCWSQARRIFASEPRRGRELLHQLYEFSPSRDRRAFLAATRVPGSSSALRLCFGARDRLRRKTAIQSNHRAG